jgi:hypothetical protein
MEILRIIAAKKKRRLVLRSTLLGEAGWHGPISQMPELVTIF